MKDLKLVQKLFLIPDFSLLSRELDNFTFNVQY